MATSRSAAGPTPRFIARVFRVGLVGAGLLPWLLPVLRAWLPLGDFGVSLDAAFLTLCHRIPERTLTLGGVAMPVCSRCAGIFLGVALGALLARPRLSAERWRQAIFAAAGLMLLEVALQDLGLHPAWHVTRLLSGLMFGYAAAVACVTALEREAREASASSASAPASTPTR